MILDIIIVYALLSWTAWIIALMFGYGFWAWHDGWIGFFIDTKKGALYICPLPFMVIKLDLGDRE